MSPLLQVTLMLLLALGPARLVPAFAAMTADLPAPQRRRLAVRSVGVATAIALILALLAFGLKRAWGVSWGASSVAMGLILLAGAIHSLFAPQAGERPNGAASPLAAPLILSPFGIAVVLLAFSASPQADDRFQLYLAGILVAVMVLNLIGLLTAKQIVRSVGLPTLRVAGWTIAILLSAVAIQAIAAPVGQLYSLQARLSDMQAYEDAPTSTNVPRAPHGGLHPWRRDPPATAPGACAGLAQGRGV